MIEARQARRAAIGAALAQADQGRFISEEVMMAWINTWDTDQEGPMPKPDIHPDAL